METEVTLKDRLFMSMLFGSMLIIAVLLGGMMIGWYDFVSAIGDIVIAATPLFWGMIFLGTLLYYVFWAFLPNEFMAKFAVVAFLIAILSLFLRMFWIIGTLIVPLLPH